MNSAISGRQTNPGSYSVPGNNCTGFVREVLDSGGIETPYSVRPKGLMSDLRNMREGESKTSNSSRKNGFMRGFPITPPLGATP